MEDEAHVLIREARASDIPGILHLLELLFAIEVDFSFDHKKQQKGVELLLSSRDAYVLVAEINGEVCFQAKLRKTSYQGLPKLPVPEPPLICSAGGGRHHYSEVDIDC